MDIFSRLQWQEPAWLLIFIFLSIIYFFYIKQKKESRISAFITEHLLRYVVTSPKGTQKKQIWIFFSTALLISIAAAGPFFSQTAQEAKHYPGANVAIILDISPSMAVTDISPNRLQQSKIQLKQFIRTLEQTRVSLIVFSANAYTVLPLTQDKQSAIHFIDAMRPDLVSIPGSNLALAISLANDALSITSHDKQNITKGLVILVSDGEIHDSGAWQTTQKLAQQGHQLFAIGVGTEAGGPVPLPNGQLVRQHGELITSQRQRETLLSLSKQGRGSYFDLSPQAWETLQHHISQLERSHFQNDTQNQKKTLLFPWFLGVALGLILVQTIRRPDVFIIIFFTASISFFSPTSDALPWQEDSALTALKQGDNQAALLQYKNINNFNGLIGQGVSFYRLQRWNQALKAFQSALNLAKTPQQRAQANYNLGNTLIHKEEFNWAKRAFQQTLLIVPSHKSAALNLTLLNEHLKKPGKKLNNNSEHQLQDTTEKTIKLERDNAGKDKRQLQHKLKQWGQLSERTQALQQLQTLKEDSETMLRKRFAIIDKNTVGLAEEKSW